jgi:hypothetical protein
MGWNSRLAPPPPYFGSLIISTTDQLVTMHHQGLHTSSVTFEGALACAGVCASYVDRCAVGTVDQLVATHHQGAHTTIVAFVPRPLKLCEDLQRLHRRKSAPEETAGESHESPRRVETQPMK